MPIAIRARQGLNQQDLNKQGLSRRQLLVRSAATFTVAGLGSLARPYLSRAADRPLITSGIQSGDVSANSAVIWARADRPAQMLVDGLPAGQDIFYRVRFDDISESGIEGETQLGHFCTAPTERTSVSFAW